MMMMIIQFAVTNYRLKCHRYVAASIQTITCHTNRQKQRSTLS